MVRAGAKNFNAVLRSSTRVIMNIWLEMESNGGATTLTFRKSMALKAFAHTAQYDSLISKVLEQEISGSSRRVLWILMQNENPIWRKSHQKAWIYSDLQTQGLQEPILCREKHFPTTTCLMLMLHIALVLHNLALPNRHGIRNQTFKLWGCSCRNQIALERARMEIPPSHLVLLFVLIKSLRGYSTVFGVNLWK